MWKSIARRGHHPQRPGPNALERFSSAPYRSPQRSEVTGGGSAGRDQLFSNPNATALGILTLVGTLVPRRASPPLCGSTAKTTKVLLS